jgi:TonB family protein
MLVSVFALAAAPSKAREWGEVGGWSIFEGSDGESCGAGLEYGGKGETSLVLVEYLDGKVGLALSNAGWSIVKGEEYELDYYLNGKAYGGGKSIGTGEPYEDRKGFVTIMDRAFVGDFAAGSSLKVYRDDVLVDSLSLTGTGAAVGRVRQCLAHLRGVKSAAERERQRWAHIPDDPFKPPPAAPAAPPRVAGDLSQLVKPLFGTIADYDYPAKALRDKMEGTVRITLTVEPDARISKCSITQSSGHAFLDEETCRIAARRLRFSAAKDAEGRQVVGTYERTVTWKLPEVEPPHPPLIIEQSEGAKPD